MNDLLAVLRAIPAPFRYLTLFLVLVIVCFPLSRLTHIPMLYLVIGLAVILGVLALFNLAVKAREKKRARDFEGNLGVNSRQSGVGREEVREAVRELAEKWSQAVTQLKGSGLSLYSLPWYLLIGEPQSGKSTTLKNSGLEFPVGGDALSGAGGTRNCDWWFSNEAIILDTAGRFTFQEENAPDQDEWSSFLKLLRRHRRDCPINGVIVVIPATSLVEDNADEQERKAKNIREKLLHVQKSLEVRVPIFVLVTKADRILGFSEFFSRLDPVDQRQLLGWSNPNPPEEPLDLAKLSGVFRDIVTRVHKVRLKFLRDEANSAQVDKLFVFPEELQAVEEPLLGYFRTIFASTRYEEPFIFRGFYVTSGVQQGRPIARACRDLLRVRVGDPQGVLENLESVFQKSRAYFIRDFYEKKLFPEQGLVTRTRAALKRDQTNLWVLRGVGAAVLLLILLGLVPAAVNLYSILDPTKKTIAEATECLKDRPCDIGRSFELAARIRDHRQKIRERRWMMTFMLRSRSNNVLQQDLATIESKLLTDFVAKPLLQSFERRAENLDGTNAAAYLAFRSSLLFELRLWAASNPWKGKSPEERNALRSEIRGELRQAPLGPLVDFSAQTKGLDPTPQGKEIDEWLARTPKVGPDADAVFVDLLDIPDLRIDPGSIVRPKPESALRAFEKYHSVSNLAKWDFDLSSRLREFRGIVDEVIALDFAGDATDQNLAKFVSLAERTKQVSDAITALLANPNAGSAPGANPPNGWVDACRADYGLLQTASRRLVDADRPPEGETPATCLKIRTDYAQVQTDRLAFAYFISEDRSAKPPKISWTPTGEKAAAAIVALGTLSDRGAFEKNELPQIRQKIEASGQAEAKLNTLLEEATRQRATHQGPIDALAEAVTKTPPDPAMRAPELQRKLQQIAALSLGLRVSAPLAEAVEAALVARCEKDPGLCYDSSYAKKFFPRVPQIVDEQQKQLVGVSSPEVQRNLDRTTATEYAFLSEFVRRQKGGGGGGGIYAPASARSAKSWKAFVKAVSAWNPSGAPATAEEPSGPAGDLSRADLAEWVGGNEKLSPVLKEFDDRMSSARAKKAKGADSPDLVQAAQQWQRCVSGLDEAAIKAWRQLVEGKEASLADFHAFTQNRRLRDGKAQQFKQLEQVGADLLSKELRPDFLKRFQQAWRPAQGYGRFPFITERDLAARRGAFERDPGADRTVWVDSALQSAQRELRWSMQLETVTFRELQELYFAPNGFDQVYEDFALRPFVDGTSTSVDFVSPHRDKVRTLRAWQEFLFEGKGQRQPQILVRTLENRGGSSRTAIGERVGLVKVFGAALRPSTDIQKKRPPTEIPGLRLDDREGPISIYGMDEASDPKKRWTGTVEIRGGPLKLFHFLLLARDDQRGSSDKTWIVRIGIPDFERPRERPEGVFEFTFDRPVPGVFASLDVND